MMRFLISLLLLLGLASGEPMADTSSSSDVLNNKIYGNCRVWTQVDMLTDDVSHHLRCKEETFSDVTEVGVSQWHVRLELRVSKGVMLHFGDFIPVAIRIDKGKVIRGEWDWFGDNMVAMLRNHDLIMSFLDELAKGKRVVIRVGKEAGNVVLDGSAAAVKDFLRRTGRG